ncbi:uncharacterized protein LOC143326480 [Chaetodon auriga]|uniref:uncharacterized protein LOC143326480 n=1 Tax=Chaetodon auriga TaxID=39042 RepID=UPI004032CC75
MSACCVSGCKNRHSSTSQLKFYRIPSGYRPFQANRRRLWLEAIEQVNGSTKGLGGNARICGAHFISGEASMNHDDPDFVPSVFTCAKQTPNPKKKVKWSYGRRKRRRRTAKVGITTPPRADPPVDLQSSVLMEETEAPSSPSVIKEEETLTEEAETEHETRLIKSETTSSPNKAPPSFKVPEGIPTLDKMSPFVLLKSVFTPPGEYRCEVCKQTFTDASQLVIHKQLHEEERVFICEICGKLYSSQADFTEHQRVHEPSFPCNMCDRSFTTSHNLKRHKLLHVKDGRKCSKCGVLFCRRHNHIVFLPQSESAQDSFIIEPEDDLVENPEVNQTAEQDCDPQNTTTVKPFLNTTAQTFLPATSNPGPLSKIHNDLPPASYRRILPNMPFPELKPLSVPHSRPPGPSDSRNNYPAAIIQPNLPQHPELPSSLKMFSPQYLTSALLQVTRNYDYILSKPTGVMKTVVKEEQCELSLTPPEERSVENIKKERIAYDLEIVL